jgi:hypothetical protein
MNPNTRLRRAGGAAWREIDGQVVVISVDLNRVRLLNGVGSYIWSHCEGRSVDELVGDVRQRYAVGEEAARADVARFVTDLVDRGMLVVEA